MILVDPASKLVMVHTAVRQKPSDRASNAETVALWLAVVEQFGKQLAVAGALCEALSAFVMLRCQFGASPDHGRSLPM
jgi:hypothetical protein